VHVTIAENIGLPDCEIPTCGLDWITTRQPVALEQWPFRPDQARDRQYTSVGSWRVGWGTIEYLGETYGQRPHEFRKFFGLPGLVRTSFELALDIDPAETPDLEQLRANGWSLVDPKEKARDPWRYRDYIRSSRAEFGVAQNRVVKMRSGWFSDRSAVYLATGRPVLAQDTGWSRNYPAGEGLLAYRTLEEAVAGVEEIERDYDRHSAAARAIAEEHFDSRKVLTRLLDGLGVS
jgi:hypothetical protein